MSTPDAITEALRRADRAAKMTDDGECMHIIDMLAGAVRTLLDLAALRDADPYEADLIWPHEVVDLIADRLRP